MVICQSHVIDGSHNHDIISKQIWAYIQHTMPKAELLKDTTPFCPEKKVILKAAKASKKL